jgi:hypothetical protein
MLPEPKSREVVFTETGFLTNSQLTIIPFLRSWLWGTETLLAEYGPSNRTALSRVSRAIFRANRGYQSGYFARIRSYKGEVDLCFLWKASTCRSRAVGPDRR